MCRSKSAVIDSSSSMDAERSSLCSARESARSLVSLCSCSARGFTGPSLTLRPSNRSIRATSSSRSSSRASSTDTPWSLVPAPKVLQLSVLDRGLILQPCQLLFHAHKFLSKTGHTLLKLGLTPTEVLEHGTKRIGRFSGVLHPGFQQLYGSREALEQAVGHQAQLFHFRNHTFQRCFPKSSETQCGLALLSSRVGLLQLLVPRALSLPESDHQHPRLGGLFQKIVQSLVGIPCPLPDL